MSSPFIVHAVHAVLGLAAITLPGGPPVGMDYTVHDAAHHRIWVPAGNTGSVDVVDTESGKVTRLEGLPTAEPNRPGRPRRGPSSAALAGADVWVGNRADNRLCAFDRASLAKGRCVQLATMPDGVAYASATHELWVTTPADRSIAIVQIAAGGKDAKPGATSTALKLDGAPEGYAVDDARGVFYTNLEDKDRTLAIDVKTRKTLATFTPGCGAEGPRGLALDGARRLLFVACTDGAVALDLAHDGKVAGRLKTGGGVDNLDYDARRRLLHVASGKDATITRARVGDAGELTAVAKLPTAKGARNPVLDAKGAAYVTDTQGGQLIVIPPPAP
jgi:DNA-binding beta-propeller fold protein YncE